MDSDAHMIGRLRKSGGSYNSLIRADAVDTVKQFASPEPHHSPAFQPSPGGFAESSGSKQPRSNMLQPSCGDLQDLLRQAEEHDQSNVSSPTSTPLDRSKVFNTAGADADEDGNLPSSAVDETETQSDTGVDSDTQPALHFPGGTLLRGISTASSSMFIPQNHNQYKTVSDLHFSRLSNITEQDRDGQAGGPRQRRTGTQDDETLQRSQSRRSFKERTV